MGEAEDTAEGPVQDTQDLSKKKKKTGENNVKTNKRRSHSETQDSGPLDKKAADVVGLNDTEIALKSITVKVRNKLLFNNSAMEGGWFDQVRKTL